MSRIGKLQIVVPKGVTVELSEDTVSAKGPKGSLSYPLPPLVSVIQEEGNIIVNRASDEQKARAMHGLARTLVSNLVTGVSTGFSRGIEINGVGYTVETKGNYVVFNLGYSHPIYYEIPEGVSITLNGKTKLTVSGADKQAVGRQTKLLVLKLLKSCLKALQSCSNKQK